MSAGEHVIVVFGAAVTAEGKPRPALQRRLREALGASAEHPRARVLVSGGPVHGKPVEALVMRAWLVEAGLAEERILVEPRALTTLENAALSVELLAPLSLARVTLVTERYHLRRSRILLARALARSGRAGVALESRAAPDTLGRGRRLAHVLWEAVKLVRDAGSAATRRVWRAHDGTR